MSVFDGLALSMGNLLGSTQEVGGFILGLITLIVLLIIVTWVLGDTVKGVALLIPAGIAVTFVALVGWWPIWTVILIALFMALAIFNPWSDSGP